MCLPLKPLSHQGTKGITPYEAWNGIKPDVSHFCVFGCAAYVQYPKWRGTNLIVRQESVCYWATELTRKVTVLEYESHSQ